MKKITFMFLIVCSMIFSSCSTALEVLGGIASIAMMPDSPQNTSSYYQPTMMASTGAGSYYSSGSYSSSYSSSSSGTSRSTSNGKMCTLCAGSGQCKTCMGRGYYYSSFGSSTKLTCPNCDRNHNGVCSSCHGSGSR